MRKCKLLEKKPKAANDAEAVGKGMAGKGNGKGEGKGKAVAETDGPGDESVQFEDRHPLSWASV